MTTTPMHVIPVLSLLRPSRGYTTASTLFLLGRILNKDRGPDQPAFSRLCSVQHLDFSLTIHVPQFFATE